MGLFVCKWNDFVRVNSSQLQRDTCTLIHASTPSQLLPFESSHLSPFRSFTMDTADTPHAALFDLPTSPLTSPPISTSMPEQPFLLNSMGLDDTNDDSETMGTQETLQMFVDTLRRAGWSFQKFIRAWVGVRLGSKDVLLEHRRYRTVQMRQNILESTMKSLQDEGLFQRPCSVCAQLEDELDCLVGRPFFNHFDTSANLETLDFDEAITIIRETAPNWHALLSPLIGNQRSHRPSGYNSESLTATNSMRLFAITSIVCYSRARKRSNFFPAMLATYLIGSGTKRRVIDTLAGLGFSQSYQQANHLMHGVAMESARYIFIFFLL